MFGIFFPPLAWVLTAAMLLGLAGLGGVSALTPPLAFPLVLLALGAVFWGLGRLSFRPGPGQAASSKPFACGEEGQPIAQPDYSQVFPFAFYFTVLHVVALMVTTVPAYTGANLVIALVYIVGAAVGLAVLYRR